MEDRIGQLEMQLEQTTQEAKRSEMDMRQKLEAQAQKSRELEEGTKVWTGEKGTTG